MKISYTYGKVKSSGGGPLRKLKSLLIMCLKRTKKLGLSGLPKPYMDNKFACLTYKFVAGNKGLRGSEKENLIVSRCTKKDLILNEMLSAYLAILAR